MSGGEILPSPFRFVFAFYLPFAGSEASGRRTGFVSKFNYRVRGHVVPSLEMERVEERGELVNDNGCARFLDWFP